MPQAGRCGGEGVLLRGNALRALQFPFGNWVWSRIDLYPKWDNILKACLHTDKAVGQLGS